MGTEGGLEEAVAVAGESGELLLDPGTFSTNQLGAGASSDNGRQPLPQNHTEHTASLAREF